MKSIKILSISILSLIGLSGCFSSDDDKQVTSCGDVKIADMNWDSASLMANIDKVILTEGYGCNATLIPGDTMPTFTSMDTKGEPDLAPELWINSIRDPLEKAFSEKRLHSVNGAPITGLGEGWWVPQYFLDANPDIKTVQDVIKRPDLFPDKEDASKGAFVTCPAGWACQLVNANLFKAFEMESKGWKLVNPGSGAGLDGSIAKAFERNENWFGYYWSPTSTVGKYPMVKLDFGVPYAGDEHWNSCMGKDDCKDPKPTSWTVSEVHSVTSDSFKNTSNEGVAKYLQDRIYPGSVMNEMLVYMTDNQATGADAAIEFLRKKSDLWTKWVSADAAEKIKAAVK